ncbi:MAG: sigma-70 family RNA polymerase sigma factor [Cyanobium sp.]
MTVHTKTPVRPARALSQKAIKQRNQRVNHYRCLVTPIAVHYGRRCPEPLDDLVQVGLLGLLRAAELYQPKTATPFEAFARPHIRGAILHYLRDSALAVRLPRRQMELHDKLRQLRAGWGSQHSQDPTSEDLRLGLGLNPQQWQELLRGQAMARPGALEDGLENSLISDAQGEESGGCSMGNEDSLISHLARLEPCLRQVIQKVVLSGWTYRRTAALLQVSPMTVQRRLKCGLAQLREALSAPNLQATSAEQDLSRSRLRHHAASVVPAC